MATTFVDLDRGRLLDVVPGRSGDVVRERVTSQPMGWTDQIQVGRSTFPGYATAIGAVLDAVLVTDHFHAIGLLAGLNRGRCRAVGFDHAGPAPGCPCSMTYRARVRIGEPGVVT
jgi:hypothetical protein